MMAMDTGATRDDDEFDTRGEFISEDEDGIRFSDDAAAVAPEFHELTPEEEVDRMFESLGLTEEECARILNLCRDEAAAKAELAGRRQLEIARTNARLEFAANPMLDGLRLEAEVSMEAFCYWLSKAGELGANPWDYDEFWKEFERDNPEARVRNVPRQVTILNQFGRPAREDMN